MNITTIGVFTTHGAAEHAIAELRAFGVANTDISYLYVNPQGNLTDAQTDSKVGSGAAGGITAGAVLGALAGLVVANGVLPGIGTLFVAGPIAAALGLTGAAATAVAGAATGAVAGGLIGALTGFGITSEDATLYEALVRAGDVLIITRSPMDAREVFTRAGAAEIRSYQVA